MNESPPLPGTADPKTWLWKWDPSDPDGLFSVTTTTEERPAFLVTVTRSPRGYTWEISYEATNKEFLVAELKHLDRMLRAAFTPIDEEK